MANILTVCRMFGSVLLLLVPAFSTEFYITYLLCGFSDMIDGAIARKTGSVSKLGSRLDAIADLMFVAASSIKLLPAIRFPWWLLLWGGAIAAIRIGNILWGYVSQKQFIALHTTMNKLTGLLLFLFPLTISFAQWKYIAIAVCSAATISALQESFYVIIKKTVGE